MLAYVLRRIAWTVPVVLVAVTLAFFLVRSIGGDPFRHGPLLGLKGPGGWVKYGDYQPPSIRGNIRRRYGLDLPWYEQYANYLAGVATFDLGPSFSFRYRTVDEIIGEQGPITLELALLALAWAVAVGVPLGVASGLRPRSAVAHGERVASAAALSLPVFFVATVAIYLFAVRLHAVPTSGWNGARAKILPSLALGLVPAAFCARLTRAATLETLAQDYVRTARAKGLRLRRVVVVHVLPGSLAAVVSALGPMLASLVTALFVVEEVFAIPGLARNYVAAASARDYPVVLGITVVVTIVTIIGNLLADIALALLDPRVREGLTRPA